MEEEREAANNSQKGLEFNIENRKRPDPITIDDNDYQDRNIDHDHHDQVQHLMKNASANEKVQDIQDDHQELPFECHVCKQRFRSRRALGGHKKAHNRPTNDNDNKNNTNDIKREGIYGPVCPLCDQYFPSMELLGSHMKTHRDKDVPRVDDRVKEAAITLTFFAHHGHRISLTTSSGEESGGGQYICRDCKVSFPSYQTDEMAAKDDKDGDDRGRGDVSAQNAGQHVCKDCNKSFKSHYALGGHRSRVHSKINSHLSSTDDDDDYGW